MPKLICPNCAKFVTVPDDAAGTTVPCPECKAPFPVPARYDPVVSVPPAVYSVAPPVDTAPPPPVAATPPPPVAPPAPPGFVPPQERPLPPAPVLPAGYSHTVGVTLQANKLAWVPAVGLTLILLLTFFTWVGSYVGGHPVYAQTAWRALAGSPARNFQLEEFTRRQSGWPADVLNKVSSDWGVMLPYLLALVAAAGIAWAERLVMTIDRRRLPKQLGFVGDVWPYRVPVLAGLATVAALLLFVQCARGFGLERAMRDAVAEKYADERTKAAGNPAELEAIGYKADQELNRFNLERTVWLDLAVLLHVLVVLAMVGRAWLDRRGDRPPPRLVLQY